MAEGGQHYDADRQWRVLRESSLGRGLLPRQTRYGHEEGIPPIHEAAPDVLVDPADFKEVIDWCHEQQVFALYHQHNTWAPPGFRYNQNGLPFCWAWAIAGNLSDARAREGQSTPLLSPVSLGWLTGWRARGNYLSEAIRGAKERGVCEMRFTPNPHSLNHRAYEDGWEENALHYRVRDVWDLGDNRLSRQKRLQYLLSALATGISVDVAFNWWMHSLSVVALENSPRSYLDVKVILRNSHNESDVISLEGQRAIPDEQYGICSALVEV